MRYLVSIVTLLLSLALPLVFLLAGASENACSSAAAAEIAAGQPPAGEGDQLQDKQVGQARDKNPQRKRKQRPNAGQGDKSAKKSAAKKKASAQQPLSKRDEGEVLKFVRAHHPELRALLLHLKHAKPTHYQRAVRQLHRTRERLEQLQSRDMEGYVLELHRWKYKSRAQLLAARLQMTPSSEGLEELRELINSKLDVELAILERNRERTEERLKRFDAQIKKNQQQRDQLIERQIRLLTSAKSSRGADHRAADNKRNKQQTVTSDDSLATDK